MTSGPFTTTHHSTANGSSWAAGYWVGGNGHNCPYCGQWAASGTIHSCQQSSALSFTLVDPRVDELNLRIAQLTARIEALEDLIRQMREERERRNLIEPPRRAIEVGE